MKRLLKTIGPIWLVGAWEKNALPEKYAAWLVAAQVARAKIVAAIFFISRPLSFAETFWLQTKRSW